MKKLLFAIAMSASVLYAEAQNKKTAFYSDKLILVSKSGDKRIDQESKLSFDYTLKVIKMNTGGTETVYSYDNVIEDGQYFKFSLEEGQQYSMITIYTDKVRPYILLTPVKESDPSVMMINTKIIY